LPLIRGPPIPHLFMRISRAGAYYEGGRVVLIARPIANAIAHVSTWKRVGYGTYEWQARIVNPGAEKNLYVGFGERASAFWTDAIFVFDRFGTYYFTTYKDGVGTQTTLTGQDWTVERTFKVEWSPGSAKLYVDGTLLATHTTNVPDVKMVRFIEIGHTATAPANLSQIYARGFGEEGI